MAEGWARLAGGAGKAGTLDTGRHLARAFPDRVAQAAGARGHFRLANGRQGRIAEIDALAREAFIVVADMTGKAASATIRAAAAIDRQAIEEIFASRVIDKTVLAFDREARAVRARTQRLLGALRLGDAPARIADMDAAATLLAAGIAETGIAALPWSREQKSLRGRAGFLRQHLGDDWPDLSDRALAKDGADWLVPHIHGLTRLDEITAERLSAALYDLLPWERRGEMDRLLPRISMRPREAVFPSIMGPRTARCSPFGCRSCSGSTAIRPSPAAACP